MFSLTRIKFFNFPHKVIIQFCYNLVVPTCTVLFSAKSRTIPARPSGLLSDSFSSVFKQLGMWIEVEYISLSHIKWTGFDTGKSDKSPGFIHNLNKIGITGCVHKIPMNDDIIRDSCTLCIFVTRGFHFAREPLK
jgi:hypothetical protein